MKLGNGDSEILIKSAEYLLGSRGRNCCGAVEAVLLFLLLFISKFYFISEKII